MDGVARYFDALADAREAVAILSADGMEVSHWVDGENFMQDMLGEIRAALARALLT